MKNNQKEHQNESLLGKPEQVRFLFGNKKETQKV